MTKQGEKLKFYKSIRNKKELNSTASIKATLFVEKTDKAKLLEILNSYIKPESHKDFEKIEKLTITRIFYYQNAEFSRESHILDENFKKLLTVEDTALENNLCRDILKICPSIQYFEDFKDQIPSFICLEPAKQYYDADWASTIEGLFFHADKNVSVEQFQNLTDTNARQTVLNKVNEALNKQFTSKWNKKLKGVKSIHSVDLVYDPETKLFTFQIKGSDKVTVFSVEERSKGALWYLTFLLKTEFRKKKLRAELGKTLYLIDEPGSNLHSSAQTNMVTDFRTLASDSNVIYTTHSQYLIDKENLSNVYIVECIRGVVKVEKYPEYLQGKNIETSYYQPIIDALEIQPFSLDINWKEVLLVEGIYDFCGFKLMFEEVLGKKLPFVIIPGTSASSLSTLISLHVGWGAKIAVLLDNDDEGRKCKKQYLDKFPTLDKNMVVLDFVRLQGDVEFEKLFTSDERMSLALLAGFKEPVTKKIFQQTLANILNSDSLKSSAKSKISPETKKRFESIYEKVSELLNISF